jgi:hypothetical protein
VYSFYLDSVCEFCSVARKSHTTDSYIFKKKVVTGFTLGLIAGEVLGVGVASWSE